MANLVGDYTLNVFWRDKIGGLSGVDTLAYVNRERAERATRAILKITNTVHATLTHEPTGRDLIDEPGDAYATKAVPPTATWPLGAGYSGKGRRWHKKEVT